MLFEQLQEKINDCKYEADEILEGTEKCYFMVVKPHFRRIVLNPKLVQYNDIIFVVDGRGEHYFNIFNYDEFEIGVTSSEFYMKYDFKGNIIK